MRCLALAQAWQDTGGQAVFVVAPAAAALVARLRSAGVEVVPLEAQPGSETDAAYTANLARHLRASWVVVDGYHFCLDYRRRLKEAGLQLLLIDDHGSPPHGYADVIVNQNPYAHEGLYRDYSSHTRLLLGARYALLRREFALWQGWPRHIPTVARKVLVTLGGSDPDNVTKTILQALQRVAISKLEAIAVVGSNNPHERSLRAALQGAPCPIRLRHHVTDMPALMAWADMAISAAGCTSWELAFMGVPALVVTLATNQEPIADWLRTTGLAWVLGRPQQWSADDVARAVTRL
ncbi:MAG: UDP-2,4-diacetamido-2,4,6-trideoxy-beta-L-altropyranose hydrolase, partial [Candidatus Binatia bacterium]|nr:UDP-2,4-diacetamido-2,4,6-trideoxy-beta-L-altropyranose hydrolase [Candidatus Binatia bacterium]